jgi:hypothetical protein
MKWPTQGKLLKGWNQHGEATSDTTNSSWGMICQFWREFEIWGEMYREKASAVSHWFTQILYEGHFTTTTKSLKNQNLLLNYLFHIDKNSHEIQRFKKLSQLPENSWKGTTKWLKMIFASCRSPLGEFSSGCLFPCKRKMLLSAAWEKVTVFPLLSHETLWMKFQKEVECGDTVNYPLLQIVVWVTESLEIMHRAAHFLLGSYIKV